MARIVPDNPFAFPQSMEVRCRRQSSNSRRFQATKGAVADEPMDGRRQGNAGAVAEDARSNIYQNPAKYTSFPRSAWECIPSSATYNNFGALRKIPMHSHAERILLTINRTFKQKLWQRDRLQSTPSTHNRRHNQLRHAIYRYRVSQEPVLLAIKPIKTTTLRVNHQALVISNE